MQCANFHLKQRKLHRCTKTRDSQLGCVQRRNIRKKQNQTQYEHFQFKLFNRQAKKTHFRYIFRCSTRDGAPWASIALMPQRRFIETDKLMRSSLDSYSMRTYLNDDAYAHHCVESIDSTECVYEKRDIVAVACWCGREKETWAV